jgi:hypothetical protein
MNLPEPTTLDFFDLLTAAKRRHDEAKAAHARGEVPDEVYLARLDELEELQRQFSTALGATEARPRLAIS